MVVELCFCSVYEVWLVRIDGCKLSTTNVVVELCFCSVYEVCLVRIDGCKLSPIDAVVEWACLLKVNGCVCSMGIIVDFCFPVSTLL